ncbi:hypothetical protein [Microcoleus phage My-WqHQDG]|nr:hypothetical protein [Microcoleus phage My-WqHQDG]
MGEVLYGAGLPYPDLGLVFDEVSYSTPMYGDSSDGITTTSMTLYNFLLTSDYPQWVEKNIVLGLATPIPLDLIEGAGTATSQQEGADEVVWFLKVGYMVADGEYLYLEILGGGRGCSVVQPTGTGRDCSSLHFIPITAICSICMPEGERWSRCPPLPPALPPAPLPIVECHDNWGVRYE